MIYVANWKMNGDKGLCESYKRHLMNVIVCPPYPLIHHFQNSALTVGAQNCSQYYKGSYTGEVSAEMLKDSGCSYVIVGHSERRAFETEAVVLEKARRVIEAGMTPIICSAELMDIDLDPKSYMIAYEPVWAIGTGKTPKPSEIFLMVNAFKMRTECETVLYGGSVNSKNADSLRDACDGFLIGGASLDVMEMQNIIR
ncbi:MAG: triosephosphate isomerase [Alphaproteobacteria bacterium]|nr:MAG: triosephosphate isomerase [Alphaproteobacteria bacterium]